MEMDVATFLEHCKANDEVSAALHQARNFIESKRDPEAEHFGYFVDFKDIAFVSTRPERLLQGYEHLIQYPFEDEGFRKYLLSSDRELAENLLAYPCRGYSLSHVKKVLADARAIKNNYKTEVRTVLHAVKPELEAFQTAVKSHPLFTKVPYGVVKFAVLEGQQFAHQETLHQALLRLYYVNRTLVPATLLFQASDPLPADEACAFMVKVSEEGPPSWTPYMWYEYMERYEEFEGVFLPWVETFLAPYRYAQGQ